MTSSKMIPYGHQSINQSDIDAVIAVLKSDFLTQGPAIEAFESRVASLCGVKHAVAVCNATGALHIACLAAELGSGDILWTSPNSFVASANCGLYCGSDIDFVDVDSKSYNISVLELEKKLIEAKKKGKLPKVLIPVHFAGQSAEMTKIFSLAKSFGFKVIEDASHGIGGRYLDRPIGSCTFSDMTVFSFHPVKIVTSGEGGMIVTNDTHLYEKLLRLRSHGVTRAEGLMTKLSEGPWYYQQIELGYNYRITDIQAALGANQVERIQDFIKTRHKLAERYNSLLEGLPVTLPWQHPDTFSAFHLYVIKTKNRKKVFESMRECGIGVNVHYIPIHTQPYYERFGFKLGDFPVAEKYYEEAISLPIYADLSEKDQDRVVSALKKSIG